MHFKASIDKRVQHVQMPENLVTGMMVCEQEKELFFCKTCLKNDKRGKDAGKFLE
jgi:hypothetical protein